MIRPLMFHRFFHLGLLVTTLLLSGCATQTYAPDQAPEYQVARDYTPFYVNGPLQESGPDMNLRTYVRMKVLRREMGYSLVQLEDSLRTGYVANEDIIPAPPRPPEPKTESDTSATGSRGRKKNAINSPRYTGEQLNDTPLPNVPPPDLNVGPEDVPSAAPTPQPSPTEKPKFRL